jgi:asparagine synthase (glutamine-hydrolysing)
MCGIAGIVSLRGDGVDRMSIVKRMNQSQIHRGPDAEGFYQDTHIALGHRRLSIIDLSSDANQPMVDESGRYVISFNGEIYNFPELKARLKSYPFRTTSDTEVILAAFIEFGETCVSQFVGQFAFAIWDRHEKRLFLARDRLGEKPFYYFISDGIFIFASEIRAILSSGLVPKNICTSSLRDYLVYESVRSPNTMIQDVKQLPPAHFGWLQEAGLKLHCYWEIVRSAGDIPVIPSYEDACKNVRRLVGDALDGQLISDVPLGVFLSGGIDSSAIAALMAERSTQAVNTLSVVFDENEFDESRYSSLIAKRFNTEHHIIKLQANSFLDGLSEYFSNVDSPSCDGPNTYIVSRAARKAGLTVAVSGIGGDELFGGYRSFNWYRGFIRYGYVWGLPRSVRHIASGLIPLLPKSFSKVKVAELIALPRNDVAEFYELIRRSFSRRTVDRLLCGKDSPQSRTDRAVSHVNDDFFALPIYGQMSVLELTNYMRNVLLKDADGLAMANSLEIRVPFCDHRLVEYVLSLPDAYKRGSRPKQLLIDSLDGLLPNEVIDRPKMGFSFPWGRWMRNDLQSFCEEQIGKLADRGIFDHDAVLDVWREFNSQRGDNGWSSVWLLVSLEQWLQRVGI